MNTFIWCDLSTFDVDQAKSFYSKIFDWEFQDHEGYHIAYNGDDALAGLYLMPEKFQQLKLPSFWMSYIQVESVEKTVEKAKQHPHAIVEIGPTAFDEHSQIALIRDPAGAGFTVYEGPDLKGRYGDGHGRMVWNVLHVSDLKLVKDFYEDLFGWIIRSEKAAPDRYQILGNEEQVIAHIDVLPESIKGKYQYWMPIFAVNSIDECISKSTEQGGSVLMTQEDKSVMLADAQAAGFMIQS